MNPGGVCGDDDDDDEDVGPVLNWQDDLFNVELEPEVAGKYMPTILTIFCFLIFKKLKADHWGYPGIAQGKDKMF